MKLAFVVSVEQTKFESVALKGNWLDTAKLLASMGYDGIELAVRDPSQLDTRKIIPLLQKIGLQVPAIGTGQAYVEENLSLTSLHPETRYKTEKRLTDHINFAHQLSAAVIIGLIRGQNSGMNNKLDLLAQAVKRLEEKIPQGSSTTLLLEPLNRYESKLLNTIDATAEFIVKTGLKKTFILADTFHMNIEEADIADTLRRYKGFIRHIHVADSNRRAPGYGHFNFAEFFSVLKDINYTGFISVECLPYPPDTAKKAISNLKKWL